MGASWALEKKCLLTTSHETLVQIKNNFKEVFLMVPSTKIHKWFSSAEQKGLQSLDKKSLEMILPPEPLVQIRKGVTERVGLKTNL